MDDLYAKYLRKNKIRASHQIDYDDVSQSMSDCGGDLDKTHMSHVSHMIRAPIGSDRHKEKFKNRLLDEAEFLLL